MTSERPKCIKCGKDMNKLNKGHWLCPDCGIEFYCGTYYTISKKGCLNKIEDVV